MAAVCSFSSYKQYRSAISSSTSSFIPHKILCVIPFLPFPEITCWFSVPRTFSPKECKTGAHTLFQGSNVNNNLSLANNDLLSSFPQLRHVLWNPKVHDQGDNYSKFTIFEHVQEFFRDPRHYTHRNTFCDTAGGSRLLIVLYYKVAYLYMYFMLGCGSGDCKSWTNHDNQNGGGNSGLYLFWNLLRLFVKLQSSRSAARRKR